MYILTGNDISKINQTVSSSIKKYNFIPINFALTEESYSEILGNLGTSSLFGERNLVIVDITESEPEVIEKFILNSESHTDLYVLYLQKLDSRTKLSKFLLSKKALVYNKEESPNSFYFGDLVVLGESVKAYEELKKLESYGEKPLAINSGIITSFKNIIALKFKTNGIKSIYSNLKSRLEVRANNLSEGDVLQIQSTLFYNELKFKRGEITESMMLISNMNTLLKYGSAK